MKIRYIFILAICVVIGLNAQNIQNNPDSNHGNKFEQLGTILPTPNNYRTASGSPGHEYWQQRAETITYYNNSPDELEYLWLQLDENEQSSTKNANYQMGTFLPEKTTTNRVEITQLPEKDNGYVLSIIDNTNKGSEAQYWKDNFLSVQPKKNEYHQTNQFLGIAKQFVTKQLDEDFEVSKTDKIDFLNRSVNYFKKNETFDKQEFEEQVFGDSNVIESFRKFDQTYRQENELELSDNFEISAQAVKKQARVFKNVLKLDKNFHIYIHGNREMIEQGIDENGRKYYKIYYEEET
jgi:hypothetical protein